MAEGRSILKMIITNFLNSIKPRAFWGELKGKDHHGTEYYEGIENSHTRKSRRWFTAIDREDLTPDIPPEWEAWLRHKRKNPPTEEEIQLNIQKMNTVIEKAKKLEMQSKKAVDDTVNNKSEFPKYDEFTPEPGMEQEKKQLN